MLPERHNQKWHHRMNNNRTRIQRTHAIVLRRRDYKDADRILTVLTPRDGKQEWIAKGIRKTTSRKAGHLELFTHTAVLVAQARTWDIITEANIVESFRHLRLDLDHIASAAYACELIDSFTQADDESGPLWELLLTVLRALDENAQATAQGEALFDPQLLMRWFELHLLSISGFQPQLFHCMGSGEPLQPETNYLSIIEGGVFGPAFHERADVEPIEVDVLKVLRFLQRNRWSEVSGLGIRSTTMRRTENILYRMLLLILEKQLKSVDFLRKLKQMV